MAGTAERGIRRKVEGRSGMGGFLVGEGRDAQNRARWGVEDGVEKGVEKWLAPSNLVRTTCKFLKYNTVSKD